MFRHSASATPSSVASCHLSLRRESSRVLTQPPLATCLRFGRCLFALSQRHRAVWGTRGRDEWLRRRYDRISGGVVGGEAVPGFSVLSSQWVGMGIRILLVWVEPPASFLRWRVPQFKPGFGLSGKCPASQTWPTNKLGCPHTMGLDGANKQ
jgi:hypothetical protein